MALATVAEVESITGTTVSASAVTRAQTMIEMHINRLEASKDDWTTRDQYWVKLAVAYQAAYLDVHPEVFSNAEVSSVSQGDMSVTFKGDPGRFLIAPLARMALSKVTWMRTRSIKVNSDFQHSSVDYEKANEDDWDDDDVVDGWEPI